MKQTIEKYNKESHATQPKMEQKDLIQKRVLERAKIKMGDTIEDMDTEEQKGNEMEFYRK